MRIATLVALGVCVALASLSTCCRAHAHAHVKERALAMDDDDEFRPLYRDYVRGARDDAAFDDYGHLRFGRSDE